MFKKQINRKKCGGINKGLSILEILIAVAIISFVCIPIIQVIYSIQPKNVLNIISGYVPVSDMANGIVKTAASFMHGSLTNTDLITRSEVYERGDLQVLFSKGGMWNPNSISRSNFLKQNCTDFNPHSGSSSSLQSSFELQPQLFTYTKEELGISTSTILTGATLIGQKLYVSANSSSTTEPDIFVYNVSSNVYAAANIFSNMQGVRVKPTLSLVTSKDTGPGISSMQSRGTYIISANTGVKSQVDILDSALLGQNHFVIPGSNSSTTPLTKVMLYASEKLVVGTEKSILPEIVLFNIQTGQVIQTIEIGYGVNDIALADDLLFVAGPRDPEIEVFDLNSNGNKIAQYDLPGGSGNAKVLLIYGDILYVGRTKGGNEFVGLEMNFERGVAGVSTSTPGFPTLSITSSIIFKEILNKKINWSIDSMLHFDEYNILLTADEYKEFQLYKNTDVDQLVSLQATVDLPARANSAMCFKNTVWITLRELEGVMSLQERPSLALIIF